MPSKRLYDEFKFVKEVFVSENFVAVTKDDSVQCFEVMVLVRNVVAEFYKLEMQVSPIKLHKTRNPMENKSSTEIIPDDEQKNFDILTEYISPSRKIFYGKNSLFKYDAEK